MHEQKIHTRMDSTEKESRYDISGKWRGTKSLAMRNNNIK